MKLKPFFCRVGSKTSLIDIIEKYIPNNIDTYVEAFFGGGAIFWGLADDKIENKQIILNDLDKNVSEQLKLLKKANTNFKLYDVPKSLKEKNKFVSQNHNNNQNNIIKYLIISCNTFGDTGKGKIYKNLNQYSKINNIKLYKTKLKNTTILNNDYKQIIKKYDKPNTLFFLDPPYELSKTLYIHNDKELDYEEMAKILANIQGIFILTINDSSNIRKLFQNFYIDPVIVRGNGYTKHKSNKIGGTDRKELIITNYKIQK